jgi:hypothetical protein
MTLVGARLMSMANSTIRESVPHQAEFNQVTAEHRKRQVPQHQSDVLRFSPQHRTGLHSADPLWL